MRRGDRRERAAQSLFSKCVEVHRRLPAACRAHIGRDAQTAKSITIIIGNEFLQPLRRWLRNQQ
jgi:hypothetical protein